MITTTFTIYLYIYLSLYIYIYKFFSFHLTNELFCAQYDRDHLQAPRGIIENTKLAYNAFVYTVIRNIL